jgi:hypothetical protein
VLRPVPWIDHVEGPVALREALLDEGEKHPVLLFFVMEEGANMPGAVEDRTRQPYLLWVAHRTFPFCLRLARRSRHELATGIGNPPTTNLSRRRREREPAGIMPRRTSQLRIECRQQAQEFRLSPRVFSLDRTEPIYGLDNGIGFSH